MSNKQVIAIFVSGIAFLLAIFWIGLSVTRRDAASASPPAAASQSAEAQPVDGNARYVVRVGGFGTAEKANQFMMDLRRKYMSAYTQPPAAQDTLYRVHIGPYDTPEQARQVANELENEGFKGVTIVPHTRD